ncbi:hypothetical protein JVU11DRAFT_9976 [Chiua virens]|nr:hypothetical protein JVU11DRAFT_9976 [Chiua virens]
MFARSVQPDLVSLFSSTGSDPLGLFLLHVDGTLPSDSFIHLLNDSTSLPAPSPPAALITAPSVYRDQHADTSQGHQLNQTVLHIQSPTLRKTFIQCPPPVPLVHASLERSVLGLKHKWLHIQVRHLSREWSFDVGIVDKAGRQGVVRCSTFQKTPQLVRHRGGAPPLLHLPLTFPPSSSNPLTAWSTITLNLATFIPQFASLAAHAQIEHDRGDLYDSFPGLAAETGAPSSSVSETSRNHQLPLPSGTYAHLAFIKIYATCRLRRIWLSNSAPITRTPWEFELYGD